MNSNAKHVAETILTQLGGRGFSLMTGAKNFMVLDGKTPGVSFHIPQAKNGINRVSITLTNDLYTIKFSRLQYVQGVPTVFPKGEYSDLFTEQMIETFREKTGLETRMPRIRVVQK